LLVSCGLGPIFAADLISFSNFGHASGSRSRFTAFRGLGLDFTLSGARFWEGDLVMSVPDSRKPSLYDAKARVARAGEHIKSLEAEVSRWHFAGAMDPSVKTAAVGFTPSALCSILIGEIAYNLKSALDYLVFELFYLATGEFDNRTKFIIEDTPEGWNSHIPGFAATPKREKTCWLHRLRPDHQAALKGLQPFSGTEWTKALQKITNPDRHRQLVEIAGMMTYTQIEVLDAGSQTVPPNTDAKMLVNFKLATRIAFWDGDVTIKEGKCAIEAMHHLQREIGAVIERFELDFQ
jgi:hypothetical protein